MRSYIDTELPALIPREFPAADLARQGITGHSMGGHGALVIALRNEGRFRSVSAFAPIASLMNCPWGEKALGGYLGVDRVSWRRHDACALLDDGAQLPNLLVDQGEADNFLVDHFQTHLLTEACERAGIDATIRLQPGYDHSYYFISTFHGRAYRMACGPPDERRGFGDTCRNRMTDTVNIEPLQVVDIASSRPAWHVVMSA